MARRRRAVNAQAFSFSDVITPLYTSVGKRKLHVHCQPSTPDSREARVSFGLWILKVKGPTLNLHILNPGVILIPGVVLIPV